MGRDRTPALLGGAVHLQLCGIGAKFAHLLAYVRYQQGRRRDADAFSTAAFELGGLAGDRALIGHTIADEAGRAYHAGQYGHSLKLTSDSEGLTDDLVVNVRLAALRARTAARLEHASAKESIDTVRDSLDAGDLVSTDSKFSFTPATALAMLSSAELWAGKAKDAKALALDAIDACSSPRDRIQNEPLGKMALAAAEIRLGNLDAGLGEATEVLTAPQFTAYSIRQYGRRLQAELLRPHAKEPAVVEFGDLLDSVSRPALPSPTA